MNWTLSGWKTNAGAIVLIAAAVVDQIVVGIWGYGPRMNEAGSCIDRCWVAQLGQTLDWVGMALGGVGLAHKGVKLIPASTAAEPKP